MKRIVLARLVIAFVASLPFTGFSEKPTPQLNGSLPAPKLRNIPNLGLVGRPFPVSGAESEATHEGKEYWKARTAWETKRRAESVSPDLFRAVAESVYGERLRNRERHPQPLAAVGWRSLGPTTDAGRVRDYEFTPDGGKLYVATAQGGIWLLTRQGSDYVNPVPLTDDLPLLTFGAVAVAPSNPTIVYAATGEQSPVSGSKVVGFGTLRSTDGGSTWAFNTSSVTGGITSLVPSLYSYDLDVNPNDPNDVLLGTTNGIFRTRNGGQTWINRMPSVQAGQSTLQLTRQGCNLVRVPGNPSTIWAGLWGGLAVSQDGGETWQVLFENIAQQVQYPGIPIRSLVSISAANPNRIYWFVAGALSNGGYSQVGVFRSDDGGQNWATALGPPQGQGYPLLAGTQGWSYLAFAADPGNADRVFAGGLDMWRSEDGGSSWTQISDWRLKEKDPHFCHADINTLAFEPGSSNLWVGSDGGLFRSLDAGRTFLWKNDGVVARMFSSLAQHPTDSYRLYAGTQDNGTMRLNGSSPTAWKRVFYGDGYDTAVNYQSPNIVYATNYNNYTSRADDGGEGETSFKGTNCQPSARTEEECALPPVTSFRSRLGMDPVNPTVLYAMTDRIYRATRGASDPTDWQPILSNYFCSDGPQSRPCPELMTGYASCSAISVDPKSGQRVAFGTSAGYLVYTVNGFQNAQTLQIGAQVNAIAWADASSFFIGLEDAAELVSGQGRNTLYLIGGLGTTSVTARPAGSGIGVPITYAGGSATYFAPVDSLAISPSNASLMFAGTKYGIFRSTNAAQSWSRFGDDFPATWVSALLFTPDGSKIRAATWGRGMWEINLLGGSTGPTTPPTPAFAFSPSNPRPGQVVTFSDQSTGGAASWSWSFGDGGTSSTQSPSHTYANEGTFTVTLNAANATGSRSTSKPVAVRFGDTGTGNAYTYLVPVILSAGGAGGTFFTTELTLANRSGKTLDLTFRTKDATSGAELSSSYSLPAGQQIQPDIITFLRSSTGMAIPSGNYVASLRIEVRGADNLTQFGAQVRVTTPPNSEQLAQGIRGRFGLSFPAVPIGRSAKKEALVYGLQQTSAVGQAGTRSNLACVHAGGGSGGAMSLEVTYSNGANGQQSASKDTLALSAFQFAQLSQPLAARGIQYGYATVRKVSGDDQFVCYAVLNDNLNGDGAFVPMVMNDEPSKTGAAVVPVIVDTATFKSELTAANRTNRAVSGVFALVPSGDPQPDWGYFNLGPGEQVTVPDIVAELRGIGFNAPPGTVASLVALFTDGALTGDQSDTYFPVPTTDEYLGVRTYASRNGGLFGLAYGYAPVGTNADTEAYIYGLQQTGTRGDEGTRSNLAVVNALGVQGEDITLEVTYYGPNGAELGKEPECAPCRLAAGQWKQFNSPLSRFDVPHGYARVRKLSGVDQFLAYGVLNDQANDDGSYVPMIVP